MERIMMAGEILDAYNRGVRDFSNIKAVGISLQGVNLNGACFINADLTFSTFRDSKLVGTDFRGANLDWADLIHADLKDANFSGARMNWCLLNDAIFDRTDFTNVDFKGSLMFRVNLQAVKTGGARFEWVAFRLDELSLEGMRMALSNLPAGKVPPELLGKLKSNVHQIHARSQILKEIETPYIRKTITSLFEIYSQKKKSGGGDIYADRSVYAEKSVYEKKTEGDRRTYNV